MKKEKLLIWIYTLLIPIVTFGQIPIYVSKQTGQFTKFQGSSQLSTKGQESINASLTFEGPLTYSLSPSSFTIGPNSTGSFDGSIFPKMDACPESGNSTNATLICNYSRTYAKGGVFDVPSGTWLRSQSKVVENDVKKTQFIIHSIGAEFEKSSFELCNGNLLLEPSVYPKGGKVSWKTKGNYTKLVFLDGDSSKAFVEINFNTNNYPNFPAMDSITVTYSFGDVTYSSTCKVSIPYELSNDPNGCAIKIVRPGYTNLGINTTGIPNELATQYHFTAANAAHDSAYGICNYIKSNADSAWLISLLHQCSGLTGDSNASECIKLAATMYSVVVNEGYKWYNDAQNEGCICCKKKEDETKIKEEVQH